MNLKIDHTNTKHDKTIFLSLVEHSEGTISLEARNHDTSQAKTLLEFKSNGKVYAIVSANIGNFSFNTDGQLVVSTKL